MKQTKGACPGGADILVARGTTNTKMNKRGCPMAIKDQGEQRAGVGGTRSVGRDCGFRWGSQGSRGEDDLNKGEGGNCEVGRA